MSIATIAQDLVDRVKAISSFSNRVGLALGGKNIDPTLRKLTVPHAWVIYMGDDIVSQDEMNPCNALIRVNFNVLVAHEYQNHNESELITTDFPLLHEVVAAVKGKSPVVGSTWAYEGQGLDIIDGRLVWVQNYSILMGL